MDYFWTPDDEQLGLANLYNDHSGRFDVDRDWQP
jgi:hypothetical protein